MIDKPLVLSLGKDEIDKFSKNRYVGYQSFLGCFNTDRPYQLIDTSRGAFLLNRAALESTFYQELKISMLEEANNWLSTIDY